MNCLVCGVQITCIREESLKLHNYIEYKFDNNQKYKNETNFGIK